MIISEDGWVFDPEPLRAAQYWVMLHGGTEPILISYRGDERGWDLTDHWGTVRCWRPLVPPSPPRLT
jgi:hypothetical protein